MATSTINIAAGARFEYSRHFLGKGRKIRIIIVGAGLTGIAAAKIFKESFPDQDVELAIYEKNSDVTGTWLENRYPGCACDVPSHAYTYSWEGNPTWSRAYVGAVELYEYFKDRANAYGINEHLHLENRITHASWDNRRGKWIVQVTDLRTGSKFEDEGEVLINAAGFLNSWKWPEIPGLHDFGGKLLHSADWDNMFQFEGKKVVVIGGGSSAVQIVPQLQPKVKHLFSINRSKIWITPKFFEEFAPDGKEALFPETHKSTWKTNKDEFLKYRREVTSALNQGMGVNYKGSDAQKQAFEFASRSMRESLGNDQSLIDKLVPGFEVGCRRPTPGPGYLEALASSNVTVKNDAIEKAIKSGLLLANGSHLEVDAIICATGFDTSFRPAFPVMAFGQDLRETWKDEPASYLSIAAPGVPNYFITSGPNFPVANGSVIACLEANIRYAFAAVKKIQYEGIKSLVPKQESVDDFQQYKESLMKDLVWTGSCISWYKNGKRDGKVWGPWPGSALHYLEIISNPRWEDFDITYLSRNRFAYFGDGRTRREIEGGDLAYYLTEPGAGALREPSLTHL